MLNQITFWSFLINKHVLSLISRFSWSFNSEMVNGFDGRIINLFGSLNRGTWGCEILIVCLRFEILADFGGIIGTNNDSVSRWISFDLSLSDNDIRRFRDTGHTGIFGNWTLRAFSYLNGSIFIVFNNFESDALLATFGRNELTDTKFNNDSVWLP